MPALFRCFYEGKAFMVAVRSVERGSSIDINGLLDGNRWTGKLSYGFARDAAPGATAVGGIAAPDALREAVGAAFADVAAFTRLDIVEARDGTAPDIRIVTADWLALSPTESVALGGYAFTPGPGSLAGDIFLGRTLAADLTPGSYGWRVVLHEVGHALGLKHPHEAGPFGRIPAYRDGPELSVMSARSAPGLPTDTGLGTEVDGFAETFMPADIAALQHLYGANYADAANTRYVFDATERVMLRTIWDGGGRDTYDFSAYADDLSISLAPGGHSRTGQEPQLNRAEEFNTRAPAIYAEGSIHNAQLHRGDTRSLIENAIGGHGDDTIAGNGADNRLAGGLGDDVLRGNDGDDRLVGAPGADRLVGGTGEDRLRGGPGADHLSGNRGDDQLGAGPGDDVVHGGMGRDTIALAGGDDTAFGERGADTLAGRAGSDALFGGAGADRLFGGAGADTLAGGAGDDTLHAGRARNGVDRLTGGDGADLFVVHGAALITDFASREGDRIDVPDPAFAFAHMTVAFGDVTLRLDTAGATLVLVDAAATGIGPDDLF